MNVLDIIRETSARETTRFSFELLPPLKGDGTRSVFTTIEALREFDPAFINVTFHRESIKETLTPDGHIEWHRMRRRPGTVGISAAIRDRFGIEVVPHLICGGLSRYDIEDALIDMDFLGLHNVLALRGDCGPNERHFMPHPQGHSHAIDLVRQTAASSSTAKWRSATTRNSRSAWRAIPKNTSTPSTPKATCATSKPRSTPAPTTS